MQCHRFPRGRAPRTAEPKSELKLGRGRDQASARLPRDDGPAPPHISAIRLPDVSGLRQGLPEHLGGLRLQPRLPPPNRGIPGRPVLPAAQEEGLLPGGPVPLPERGTGLSGPKPGLAPLGVPGLPPLGPLRRASVLPGTTGAGAKGRAPRRGRRLHGQRGVLQGLADGRRGDRPRPRERPLRVRQARDARDHGPEEAEPRGTREDQPRLLPASKPEQAQTRLERVGGEDAAQEARRGDLERRERADDLADSLADELEPRGLGGPCGPHRRGPPRPSPRPGRAQLPVHDALAHVHDHDLDDPLPHASLHDNRPVPRGRGHRLILERPERLEPAAAGPESPRSTLTLVWLSRFGYTDPLHWLDNPPSRHPARIASPGR
jgi:hypothetical protein